MRQLICGQKTNTDHLSSTNSGFTIVELIVVIVVIAVIAVVGFLGLFEEIKNSTSSSLQSSLNNSAKQLVVDQIRSSSGTFPATLAVANNGTGIKFNPSVTTLYTVDNSDTPKTFCLSATQNGQSYFVTQESKPLPGPCPVLYLDAGIGTSYPGSGTLWNDLSGNGRNGTIASGATYTSSSGGAFGFNGTSGYINYNAGGFLPTGASTRTIMFWYKANAGMTDANGAFSYGCNVAEAMNCTDSGQGRYVFAWANTSNIGFHLETCAVFGSNTPSPSGGWHLFTAVFNGNNTITFYVDGANSTTVTPGCTINSAAGVGYDIGGGRWGYYNGSLGDIRVFNSAMSADFVMKNYNALRSRYGV